ncbi:calmodulin [Elysia marginata]|uniref:Calmodulin n=1 Tax=Elysia marginata TaxID=1093978 RepID=A0AAV4EX69_9GAST|nr:calmodulin [Elysia marginata]
MPQKTNKSFEEKCRAFFEQANGGDPVTPGQLARVIRKACPSFEGSDQDIAQMFMAVNTDNNDTISWEEFSSALFARDIKEVTRAELEETFKKLDKDNSGKLSREEVKNLMTDLEIPIEEDALDQTMAQADPDNNGVDIKEFLALFKDLNV